MNIDRYLRRTKRGSWKLRLSYSRPNMKAERVEIGLNTRDLKIARIAAVSVVNSMHAVNARNNYFLGLIRPMDKQTLSCTKRALKSKMFEIFDGKEIKRKTPITSEEHPVFQIIEDFFA